MAKNFSGRALNNPLTRTVAQSTKIATIATLMSALLDKNFNENNKPVWVFFILGFMGMLDGILRECNPKYSALTRIPVDVTSKYFECVASLGLSTTTLFNTSSHRLLPLLFILGIYPAIDELDVYLGRENDPRFLNQFAAASLRALSLLTLFTVINNTQETPIIAEKTQRQVFAAQLLIDLITQALFYILRPQAKTKLNRLINTVFELSTASLLLFEVLMGVSITLMKDQYFGSWLFGINATIAGLVGIIRAGIQYNDKPALYSQTTSSLEELLLPRNEELTDTSETEMASLENSTHSAEEAPAKEETWHDRASQFFYARSCSAAGFFAATVANIEQGIKERAAELRTIYGK